MPNSALDDLGIPASLADAAQPSANASAPSAAPPSWSGPTTVSPDDAVAAARAAGVDPDLYTRLVFSGESGGNARAVSKKGALGAAQLMPPTAKDLGVNPYDAQDNLKGGAVYLKSLMDRYKGDPQKALAAYNAGPAAVDQAGGVPNIPETQAYVSRVLNSALPRTAASPSSASAPSALDDMGIPAPFTGVGATATPAGAANAGPSSGTAPITHIEWNAKTNRYEDASGTPYVRTGDTTVAGPNGAQYVITPNAPGAAGQVPIRAATPGLDAGTTDTARAAFMPGLAQGVENVGSTFKNLDQFVEQNVPGARQLNQFLDGSGYPTVDQQVQQLHANRLMNDARYAGNPAYGIGKTTGEIGAVAPFMVAGGGALSPVVAGEGLLSGAGSMAANGAVQGGVGGALASGGSDRPLTQQVIGGALTGAALGPVLGAAGAGVRAVGQKLGIGGTAVNPNPFLLNEPELGAGALGSKSPAMRTAMTLRNALARDGVTPEQAVAAARSDPTAPAFHAGGPNVAGLAEVAAKSPGPAQTIIRNAVTSHQDAVPDQIRGDIGAALGGKGDYLDALDSTIQARREAANQGIAPIENQPVQLNDNSVLALRSPPAKGAIKAQADNLLASADPADRAAGASLNRIADTVLDNPGSATLTIRDAQNISRSLLNGADSAYRVGDGAKGVALKTLGRAIRDNASDPTKGGSQDYADWLSKYGEDSDNLDALKLGHNVLSQAGGNTAPQVQKTLMGMSPAAADYYKKGVAEALIDATNTAKGGVGTMRQLLKTKDLQDKVKIAFPDDASYQQFVQSAENRVRQQGLNNKVIGGSPTYPLQAARVDVEEQPFHLIDAIPHMTETLGNLFTGNVGGLAGQGFKNLLKTVPRADRSVIGDPTSNALLGHALSDPNALETLLTLPERAAWERANPKNPMLTTVAPTRNDFLTSAPVQRALAAANSNLIPAATIGVNALQGNGGGR